ncbi:uncharacterized protein LOC133724183 [Rosa rugosa]|uniref:uncharacterized protein LOC133724183 n=1 Tax=Rosa rugosa TaxID=74645 RepID=UPI002B41259F|nr:uncharacterized protein LOC133724183 [Rosa rugosa]
MEPLWRSRSPLTFDASIGMHRSLQFFSLSSRFHLSVFKNLGDEFRQRKRLNLWGRSIILSWLRKIHKWQVEGNWPSYLYKSLSEFIGFEYRPKRENGEKQMFTVRSVRITQQSSQGNPSSPNGPVGGVVFVLVELSTGLTFVYGVW